MNEWQYLRTNTLSADMCDVLLSSYYLLQICHARLRANVHRQVNAEVVSVDEVAPQVAQLFQKLRYRLACEVGNNLNTELVTDRHVRGLVVVLYAETSEGKNFNIVKIYLWQ